MIRRERERLKQERKNINDHRCVEMYLIPFVSSAKCSLCLALRLSIYGEFMDIQRKFFISSSSSSLLERVFNVCIVLVCIVVGLIASA